MSIVIPVYNGAKYLEQALNSVLNQTFKDFEIIVVDDGSIDSSPEVVRFFINSKKGLIRYYKQDNNGVSAARNLGIKMATCPLIAFLDQDDLWYPNKLDLQIAVLKKEKEVKLVSCGFTIFNDESGIIHTEIKNNLSNQIRFIEGLKLSNIVGPPSCVIVKKECLDKVGLFDSLLAGPEDRDLWFRIVNKYMIKIIGQVLVQYRLHSNNAHLNIMKMKTNQIKFISKHSSSYTFLSKRKAYSYAYLDGSREYYKARKMLSAIGNAIIAILLYPFKIIESDDKYQILIKSIIGYEKFFKK